MRLLWLAGLRYHLRHPLQTMSTLLGIAAGTALLVAMQCAQRTAETAFDQALATVAGSATHTATAGPAGIPVERYTAAVVELGAGLLAPSVSAIARASGRSERTVLRVLGIDPLADVGLRPWAAAGPRQAALPLGALMTTPGAFVATPQLLARLGLQAGGALALTVGGRPVVGQCLGELSASASQAAGLADVLLVDIATAQEWSGRHDRIDRIDLRLTAEQAATVVPRLQALLGPLAQVRAAGSQQGRLGELARGFRINLTALSLLSLLVGAFLVHETMRLSVAARRPQFGALRALGATGRPLWLAVAGEALLLGLLGSLLGAVLGGFGADLLLQPLVRTLNDHYATFSLQSVELAPAVLIACVALGAGTALLAGLGPAIAAGRTTARSALAPARAVVAVAPWWRLPLLLALPVGALAFVLLRTVGDRLVQGYLGLLAVVIASLLLVPAALQLLLVVADKLLTRVGPYARYVVRSTAAGRQHLALPVAAMVLALAATIGMATLVQSFRISVTQWLEQVLPGDVFIAVPGGTDERTQPLEPKLAVALLAEAGIAAVTAYHRTVLPVRAPATAAAADTNVVGVQPSAAWERSFPLLAGDDDVRAALRTGAGAFVSEPLAFRRGLGVGARLEFQTEQGPVELPVAAIYRDYGNERGEILVGADWLQQRVRAPVTAVAFEAAAGGEVMALAERLRQRAAVSSEQAVEVRVQRELRESSLQVFDRTFAITGVMRILCLLVACIGIYAAFAALQLERGPEIGLLRCLGAVPAHIGLVVLGQTALLGLCAGLLAWPLGALLGHLLANVINRVSFGWSLVEVAVPSSAVIEVLWLAVAAALLAGLAPAYRFARMRPADGLREA